MPPHRSVLRSAVVLGSLLLPACLQAQPVCTTAPSLGAASGPESILARARAAAELRQLLLDVGALSQTTVPTDVKQFLEDPYVGPSVSLGDLERCIAVVGREPGPDGAPRNGMQLNGVAALADVATGGAATAGLSALSLADGLTDFMVERAKDEAAFSLILAVRREVNADNFLKEALPRTAAILLNIETGTFQSLMPLVRSAMVQDLNELPTRHEQIITRLGVTQEQGKVYVQGVSLAYSLGLEMRRGTAPGVALADLVNLEVADLNHPSARRALRLLGAAAREYAGAGGEAMLRELVASDAAWMRRYFVALLAREVVALDVVPGVDMNAFMQHMRTREADAMLLLNQLHAIGQSGMGSRDDLLRSVGGALAVLRVAPRFVPATAGGADATLARFVSFLDDATELHQAVSDRDYSAVISWVVNNENLPKCTGQGGVCEARTRVLALAASLAAAENSEEVTTALRTASAPVGSYRAKRSQSGEWLAPRTVSLLGYLGGAWRNGTEEVQDFAGLSLPVGPEVSLGVPAGAVSLFVPLLDLGPLADQALGLGPDDTDGEYDLQNIVAPGVAVVLNLTRSFPVSVGFGVQSVRREYEIETGTQAKRDARMLIFLGVDATLMQFRL